MTKHEKLMERLLSKPTDFTWKELTKALGGLGYKEINGGKTGGSRTRFIHHLDYPPIILHRPHPKPILKRYQLDNIIEMLKWEELL